MSLALFLLIAIGSLACAQQPNDTLEFGSVAGQVVDQTGKPVEGVQIFALPMEKASVNGKVMFTVSGQDGKFLLSRVQTGLNMICFAKLVELYPDTRFAASTDDITLNPIVSVKRDETTQDVLIRLGRKGARLLGKISDRKTGQMVKNTHLLLSWADDSGKSIETTADLEGRFEFIVAPKRLRLEVSAPGYKQWISPAILVAPGETRQLTVTLEPTA
jgi:hypothetical protein